MQYFIYVVFVVLVIFSSNLNNTFAEDLPPTPAIQSVSGIKTLDTQRKELLQKSDTLIQQGTAIMEENLLDCLKEHPKAEIFPGVYHFELNAPADQYFLTINTTSSVNEVAVRRRTFSTLGAKSWGDNPPNPREYPSIVFVDKGRDGTVDDRTINFGHIGDFGLVEDFFKDETFQGILTQFMEECSRNIPKK